MDAYREQAREEGDTGNMRQDRPADLEARVARAAEAMLARQRYVSALDVMLAIGWLAPSHPGEWRQGRLECVEEVLQTRPARVAQALRALREWAQRQGLAPNEIAYAARTRDQRPLRFSASGDPEIERAYRTHWVPPELAGQARDRLLARLAKPPELVVVSPLHADWTCTRCRGTGGLLIMEEEGPVCLACTGLAHLVYLPSGDPVVTRRARATSALSAVVVRWSRARKRYERQGLLVEPAALEAAEAGRAAEARVPVVTRPPRPSRHTGAGSRRPASSPSDSEPRPPVSPRRRR